MYGTNNIDLQAMIEHGLNTEEWIWKYFQPIKDFESDIQNERNSMKPINQMTLKELKKEEMDLSEYLHFKDQRNEKISQEERNELDAIRSRLDELDPPKY